MGGVVLNGIVVEGLREGSFFLSLEHYKGEINEKLGFDPYPGTLNIKVNNEQINLIKNISPVRIDGFEENNKKYYGANCYKARIKNIEGAVITPDLTRHKDTIEFIAPYHLKSKLNIKNGDKVKIELIK